MVDDADGAQEARTSTGPPPRPALSGSAPPPVQVVVPPPMTVKISRALWFISFLAGFGAVASVFLASEAQLDNLREVIARLSPDTDQDALHVASNIVLWGSLVAIIVVLIVEGILLARMMGRHGLVRWGMLVFLLVHGAVMLVVSSVLALPGAGPYLRLLLVGQLALAGAALIVSLLPSAGAWFRGKRQPHDGAN